ncbi:MAG: rane associated hydrolase, partial [Acidobacteria bacterium]|nr:rane associated hydrolase [Acidobacteriota bacterium]
VDYNAVLPNSSLVNLERTKRFGLDFLFTYMLHPGTAVHAGYTDNYENLHVDPMASPNLVRNGLPDTSVGRQVFVKLSYLFRM